MIPVPLDVIVGELFDLLAEELPLHVVTGPLVRLIKTRSVAALDRLAERLRAKGHAVIASAVSAPNPPAA